MLFLYLISNAIKHRITGEMNDMTEKMKNRGEIIKLFLQLDSNLYFLVCTMSRITSQNDQIDEQRGIYLVITERKCWKCSLDL